MFLSPHPQSNVMSWCR